jgi:hypothetical protein
LYNMRIPAMSSTDSGTPKKSGRSAPDCWSACSGYSE